MNTSAPNAQPAGSHFGQSTAGSTASGTAASGTTTADSGTAGPAGSAGAGSKKLFRTRQGRLLTGVAAGIAEYSGLDVTLVRIAFVLVTLIGGIGIPLYLASWLLIPDENSAQSIAAGLASDMLEWRN